MRKKCLVYVLSGMLVGSLLTGCANEGKKENMQSDVSVDESDTIKESDDIEVSDAIEESTPIEENDTIGERSEEGTLEEESEALENAFSFADVAGREFYFSSGAGGWDTTLSIKADGSFEGQYHDSDMGDLGEGYPNGTMYQCIFKGQFSGLQMVDEFTYQTSITDMTYEKEPGTEEIVDEMHLIYAEPYGLENTKSFYFYLPGISVDKLPKEYVEWVHWEIYDSETNEEAKDLPFYGLYNVEQKYGFSSYQFVERFLENLKYSQMYTEEIEKSIENDDLSQTEYNQKAADLYNEYDRMLNALWSTLKQCLSKDEMDTLTASQREWIKKKEEAVASAGAEWEGGSMQPMVEYLRAANLTKERINELLQYLE